ncbi:MAG: 50S ribosomal protein L6 [Thermicanus sp.]|nr:50S ribosomal protein L6 [Thermicanus sp.]
MSRIGLKPITLPSGVQVTQEGNTLTVKGPKGSLTRTFHPDMKIKVEGDRITVARASEDKFHKSLHGTTRALLANMVTGVTEGYQNALDIVGVGYRATKQGNKLVLTLGYSHPVEYQPEEGIEIEVPSATKVIVKGINKERVGEVAAKIRSFKEPEPYKGKGIKYENEVIRRKEGKTGGKKK